MIPLPKHLLAGLLLLSASFGSRAQTGGSKYEYIFDMVEQQDYAQAKTELDRIPEKDIQNTFTTTRRSATVKKPPPLFGWLLIPFLALDALTPKTKEHRVYLLEYTVALEKISPEKTEFIEFLLKRGANPNRAAGFKTPLALAVAAGDNETAKLLFRYGAMANGGFYGDTPLNIAFRQNNRELIRFFMENNVTFPEGMTDNALIASAAVSGDMDLLKMLLVSKVKFEGPGLMKRVAEMSKKKEKLPDSIYADIVNTLISYGLNTNETDKYTQGLPLHSALREGCDGLALALIPHTNNINLPDKDGETPLMYAVKSGNPAIVNLLMEKGADPNLKNKKGETARNIAIANNRNEIMDRLESNDPAQRERNRALAYLLINDSIDAKIKIDSAVRLINAGVNMDACRIRAYMDTKKYHYYFGPTNFLHYTVKYNQPQIAEALLKAGADPNVNDTRDKALPLKYALTHSDTNMARLLITYGANVNDTSLKKYVADFRPNGSEVSTNMAVVRDMLLAEVLKSLHTATSPEGQFYADRKGNNVFALTYDSVTTFHPMGYALVEKAGRWTVIDIAGKRLLADCDSITPMETVYDAANGKNVLLVRFKKYDLWSVKALYGKTRWTRDAYDRISPFGYKDRRGGGYALCLYAGKYSFVDVHGQSPFPKYDQITRDKKGRIFGTVDGKRQRVKLAGVVSF